MNGAYTTVGEHTSLFTVMDQGANHFIEKSLLLFGSYEEGLERARLADQIIEEARERRNIYVASSNAAKALEAANLQAKASEQMTKAAETMANTTPEPKSIPAQTVDHGIQPGFAQATWPPFQPPQGMFYPPPPNNMSLYDLGVHNDLHWGFMQDWNMLPDFSKNYFLHFPDSFPLLLPQHAQQWYHLPDYARGMAGIDPFHFLTGFPF